MKELFRQQDKARANAESDSGRREVASTFPGVSWSIYSGPGECAHFESRFRLSRLPVVHPYWNSLKALQDVFIARALAYTPFLWTSGRPLSAPYFFSSFVPLFYPLHIHIPIPRKLRDYFCPKYHLERHRMRLTEISSFLIGTLLDLARLFWDWNSG